MLQESAFRSATESSKALKLSVESLSKESAEVSQRATLALEGLTKARSVAAASKGELEDLTSRMEATCSEYEGTVPHSFPLAAHNPGPCRTSHCAQRIPAPHSFPLATHGGWVSILRGLADIQQSWTLSRQSLRAAHSCYGTTCFAVCSMLELTADCACRGSRNSEASEERRCRRSAHRHLGRPLDTGAGSSQDQNRGGPDDFQQSIDLCGIEFVCMDPCMYS